MLDWRNFMNESDMSNIMNELNSMLKKNEFPEDIKKILNNFTNSSNNKNEDNKNDKGNNNFSNNSTSKSETANDFDIDINTILKMKKMIDSINSNKNDPRSNLLLSLKPYLKESRKKKVDQYIKLFGLSKAFETFNNLGGDNKNDV